ncbi:MAG: hypothetical protein EOP87_00890 [Verrucomicrobiaceae bacterium]|nr:MAG: hypothetical protein EOP87_00890 [Verrucomicrobiaceae bacterium]
MSKPMLATVLPANTGETFHVPLATCDGYDVEQHHTGLLYWDSPTRLNNSTVDELPDPVASGAGAVAFVTDATAAIAAGHGTVVAGGGANKVPVYSDGTDWRIG